MKTRIMRGIGWCILLLLAGCKTADDTPQVSSDKVNLTLSVATTLSGNAKSRADLPEAEKIHTLRVIIFDENGVEHNELVYDNAVTGVEELSRKTFEVRTNSSKTIYLLANAEKLPDLNLTQSEGLEQRILGYDQVTIDYLREADCLPMSSSYKFRVNEENKDCGTLYVAYAATKFTFTFENQMADGVLGISDIIINQVASTSYLYPQDVDIRWLNRLLNKEIVTSYAIPDVAVHSPFSLENTERVVIEKGGTYTFPPVYVTESKNVNAIDNEQSYLLGLKIGRGEDAAADLIRDVQLTDGTNPLNSLFRNTHVDVKIVVKKLDQIEVIQGIYGMINPWEEIDPVEGSIVEGENQTKMRRL